MCKWDPDDNELKALKFPVALDDIYEYVTHVNLVKKEWAIGKGSI